MINFFCRKNQFREGSSGGEIFLNLNSNIMENLLPPEIIEIIQSYVKEIHTLKLGRRKEKKEDESTLRSRHGIACVRRKELKHKYNVRKAEV